MDLGRVEVLFYVDKNKLDPNEKKVKGKKLKEIFSKENKLNIEIKNKISLKKYPGKILKVSLCLNGKENKEIMELGTLEPIIKFYGRLSNELNIKFPDYKNICFFIGEEQKGIKKDDERTFSCKEVNINSDFTCVIIDKNFKKKKSTFNIK